MAQFLGAKVEPQVGLIDEDGSNMIKVDKGWVS